MEYKDNFIGREINNYRLLRLLGSGGFANVYLGENIHIKMYAAIKILHTHRSSPQACVAFQEEAQTLVGLDHPSILQFLHFGLDGDAPYLITKYAENGSLRDRLPPSPNVLPLQEVRDILWQVGTALYYIHQQNVIHRDLKPANILFNAQGKALLADFGIARIVAAADVGKNEMTSGVVGTAAYMAPEQFKGRFSEKSDQYALGCMTYQLLVGRTPFTGDTWEGLAHKHLTETPASPHVLNPQIPLYMSQATMKALAKEPDERFVDISAYLTAMRLTLLHMQTDVARKDIQKLLHQAHALLQKGRLNKSFTIYTQAIDIDPKSVKAFYGKGEVLQRLRDYWGAHAAYSQAVNLDKKFIPAHIGCGDVYCHLGHYDQAIVAYQKAVQIAPDAGVYLKMAEACEKWGKNNEALASYETAIHYGADRIETRKKKIKLLKASHSYAEAAKEYDAIIRVSPDPPAACEEKREFFLSIRNDDEAFAMNGIFATYEQVIKLKPKATKLYYQGIADIENLVADASKRLEIFETLVNRVPDTIKVHVYYRIAEQLKLLNRRQETPAIYDRIIELVPGYLNAYYEKLAVFEWLNWPKHSREDALATCDQILKQEPSDLAIHPKKQLLLELLERYEEVIEECRQILDLDSKCADVYHCRGKAYEKLASISGNTKNNILSSRFTAVPSGYLKALADYEQAARIDPDNFSYRESIAKLLERLGKRNPARGSRKVKSRHSVLSWLLAFLLLPTLANFSIGTPLLLFVQHLSMWEYMVVGAFCISAVGVGFISVGEREPLLQKYHLYNASLLALPVACFTVGWLTVCLLFLHLEMLASSVIALFVAFSLTIVYAWLDSYEEYAFVHIIKAISSAWKGLSKIWGKFIRGCQVLREKWRAHQKEREKAIAAQVAKVIQDASLKKNMPRAKPIVSNDSYSHLSDKPFLKPLKVKPEQANKNDALRKPVQSYSRQKQQKCLVCSGTRRATCPQCGRGSNPALTWKKNKK